MTAWATQFGTTTATSDVTVPAGVTVTITGSVTARAVTVEATGVLEFDPAASGHLHAYGSVVNSGTLRARPTSAAVVHELTFEGVNEANYVGGGMHDPVLMASDIGLWVIDFGVLDLAGTVRRAWTKTTAALAVGATTVTVADVPTGWQAGDELAITPTAAPTVTGFHDQFERVTVTGVAGNTVTFTPALAYAHPAVTLSNPPTALAMPTTYGAEVINLTRNVKIGGTPTGRAHINLVHLGGHAAGSAPQTISDVEIKHVGPQRLVAGTAYYEVVPGRYALHFHHCGEGSRGSTITRVVIHDAGNRGFVPHASHGITYTDCAVFSFTGQAYWWDLDLASDASDDILWDRCIGAKMLVPLNASQDPRGTVFQLGDGDRNIVRDSVACGGLGTRDASGFAWPEFAADVWTFERNLSHNNTRNGLFVWQNNSFHHHIDDFVAYHCGQAGVDHGAYRNVYIYKRVHVHGCLVAGIRQHSSSGVGQRMSFEDVTIDGAGFGKHGALILHPNLRPGTDTLMQRVRVQNITDAVVHVTVEGPGDEEQLIQLRDWTIDAGIPTSRYFYFEPGLTLGIRELDVLRVRNWNADGQFFDLRPNEAGNAGTLVPEWNALRTAVADNFLAVDYGTPVATETFTVADGAWPARWTTNDSATNADVQVVSGGGFMSVVNTTGAVATAIADDVSLADYSVRMRVRFRESTSQGIFQAWLRASGTVGTAGRPTTGVGVSITNSSTTVTVLQANSDGTTTQLDTLALPSTWLQNITDGFWMRMEAVAGNFRARFWEFGTAEPGTWNDLTASEAVPTVPQSGTKTHLAMVRSSGARAVTVDDLEWWDLRVPPKIVAVPVEVQSAPGSLSAPVVIKLDDDSTPTVTATSDVPWLTPSPVSAAAPATFTLTATPSGLLAGTHAAIVTFAGPGDQIVATTEVFLTVPAAATQRPSLFVRLGGPLLRLPQPTA